MDSTSADRGVQPARHPVPRWRARRLARRPLLAIAAATAVAAIVTLAQRATSADVLRKESTIAMRQYVTLETPRSEALDGDIRLPATLQGAAESPLYARANGYVAQWTKDIGSHVEKGELLARIDAPEIDQQLAEAVAARRLAAAGFTLASSTSDRWKTLRQQDLVPQQELDEREAAEAQAQATLAASEANVARLRQMVAYERVVAPFAGVVTQRNIEVGELVGPGAPGPARPLFTLTQTSPLRVSIQVPQAAAADISVGTKVAVKAADFGGKTIDSTVIRTAGALDATTRSLQVEIELPNADGKLLPGAYVQVKIPGGAAKVVTLPGSTLLFRPQGPVVAVVDHERVRLRPVLVGRDLGSRFELAGVAVSDRVVLNPPDSLADGDVVTVVAAPPPKASAAHAS